MARFIRFIRLSSSLVSLQVELDAIRDAARSCGLNVRRVDRVISQQKSRVVSLSDVSRDLSVEPVTPPVSSVPVSPGDLPADPVTPSVSPVPVSPGDLPVDPVTPSVSSVPVSPGLVSESSASDSSQEKLSFVKLPHINDARTRALSDLLRDSNIKPVFVSPGNLYSLVRVKESRIPSHLGVANVVYKFVCHSCDNSYIGYTERVLMARVTEHVRGKSPLSEAHRELCSTPVSRADFVVHDTGRTLLELRIKEAVHIRVVRPSLNRRVEGWTFKLRL